MVLHWRDGLRMARLNMMGEHINIKPSFIYSSTTKQNKIRYWTFETRKFIQSFKDCNNNIKKNEQDKTNKNFSLFLFFYSTVHALNKICRDTWLQLTSVKLTFKKAVILKLYIVVSLRGSVGPSALSDSETVFYLAENRFVRNRKLYIFFL